MSSFQVGKSISVGAGGTFVWNGTAWVYQRPTLRGLRGHDRLLGSAESDILHGEQGNDMLSGGGGDDILNGGLGRDVLDGGQGADRFVFSSAADSPARNGQFDLIRSFASAAHTANASERDLIDFSSLQPDHALRWTGTEATAFGVWTGRSKGTTMIYADTDGDGRAEFAVQIGAAVTLSHRDFLGLTAPAAPSVTLQSDTGIAGDALTNDGRLSLSGVEARATVQYSTDGGSTWNASFAAGEGANEVLVRQVDAWGVPSEATSFTFTLDTLVAAPVITGWSEDTGSADDGVTTDADLTLSGTAEAHATVSVFDGEVLLGSTVVAEDGSWSLETGELLATAHSFTARALDRAGNESAFSTALDVSVSRSVIDVTTLSPAQGFIIQGDEAGDNFGWSAASAGDINGDGFDDFAASAFAGNDGGSLAGETYVVFGKSAPYGSADAAGRRALDLTTLAPEDGLIIQGDAAGDQSGFAIAGAGDVNGDGFTDLLIGARLGDDGGNDAGEVYVVYGGASGFGAVDATGRRVLDLSTLTSAQGFVIQGDMAGDQAGHSLAAAGDVNGDGFDDIIVGERYSDDDGVNSGAAYVIFGSATGGVTRIDLSTLSDEQGFVIRGDAAGDNAGASVGAAGDINGDGYADVVVGAPGGDDVATNAGEAYVIYGKAAGFGAADAANRYVVDLSTLTAAEGFILRGAAEGDAAGIAVSTAGDVNADGYDDLIVGVYASDVAAHDAGEAQVIFGGPAGFGTPDASGRNVLDLAGLTAAQGFTIRGEAASDLTAWSVAKAGDVNGDGYDDLIVNARQGDDGGVDAGEAYVIFGRATGFGTADGAGGRLIDLATLSPGQGFIVQGDAAGDTLGSAVSSAGDINGDGFGDLVVGARLGDDGGADAGEAYVIYGGAFGLGSTPVTTTGTAAADILVGGLGNDMLSGNGGADVLRGGAGNDLLAVSDTGFLRIDGGTGTDTLRLQGSGLHLDLDAMLPGKITSIEGIDLTGTGNNRLTIGKLDALGLTEERSGGQAVLTITGNAGDSVSAVGQIWSHAGAVTEGGVSFGRYTVDGVELRIQNGVAVELRQGIDVTNLTAAQGFIIQGDAAGDLAGHPVASAGDVNGDGFDDIILGAYRGDDGGDFAGEAYVIFGKAGDFGVLDASGRPVIDLTSLSPAEGFIIQGDSAGDRLGRGLAAAGDVNGDGFADIIVGAYQGDDGGNYAGDGYVVFGRAAGFGAMDAAGRQVVDLSFLSAADGFIIQGDVTGDRLGRGIGTAGDINGDGFDDVIIGAYRGGDGGFNAGEAYVIFGGRVGPGMPGGTGRSVVDLTNLTPSRGFVIQGDAEGDIAGIGVASGGDINGDGYDDMIVGAFGDDGGSSAGEVYVIFGKASGFGAADATGRHVLDLTSLTPADGFIIQGDAEGDELGFSVAFAGDLNGDGYDDLVTGAKQGDDGGITAGEAYVIFGKASGFGTSVTFDGVTRQVLDLTALSPAAGFIVQGDAAGDELGRTVASAGDVNGDGYGDLIVGSWFGDDGGIDAGEVYLIFGKASGFGSDVTIDGVTRRVLDLTTLAPEDGFIIQGDAAGDQLGRRVASAGDINGDGFGDLIVGAGKGDDGGADAGEAYVIYGGAFGRGAAPVVTTGTAAAEILIGGLGNDTLSGKGGADVLRGGAGDDVLAISGAGFADIDGGTGTDTLALDGAGIPLDLAAMLPGEIKSIERIDLTGTGNNSLTLDRHAVLDLTEERTGGAAILTVNGNAGDAVSLADAGWSDLGTITVNGESFRRYGNDGAELRVRDGVTVSATQGLGGADTGSAAQTVIDVQTLSAAQGFIIRGDTGGDMTGFSVAAAGDINGDGIGDIVIGAPGGDDGGMDAGEAYVVLGSASGFGTADASGRRVIDLTTLSAAQGFVIQGDVAEDGAGMSVTRAGDFNGDGFEDLVVGAPFGDDRGMSAGESYIVWGSASGFGSADAAGRQVIDLSTYPIAQGFFIRGDAALDLAGTSISAAGDVNGDGYDDVIMGASGGDDGGDNAGEAYVLFGGPGPFGGTAATRRVFTVGTLTPAQGFIIQGDAVFDQAGISVSSAGDINGDGLSDLLVGSTASGDGDAAQAYVVFGNASGFGTVADALGRQVMDLTSLSSSQGFILRGAATGDAAFTVSSAGDVNGDGFDDMIVGSSRGDLGGTDAGEVHVVYGSAAGFGTADASGRMVLDLTALSASQGFTVKGDAPGDEAGVSVSSAGDINGDGLDDLLIGADGKAYVVFGKASGIGTADAGGRMVLDLSGLAAADGFMVAGEGLGGSVSAAGDVNDDGFDDLIVGAPRNDAGGGDAGEAYVVFGGAFGRGNTPVSTTGTAAADVILGGLGSDTLAGGGGADVLRGGAGNDVLGISDTSFARIDGGNGTDTLRLDGAGMSLNLATIQPGRISSVEQIDLTGIGNNTLTVDRLAVLDLSEERAGGKAILTVTGNSGDAIGFADSGWVYQGSMASGTKGFERYVNGNAEVRVEGNVLPNISRVIDTTTLLPGQGFIIQGDTAGDVAGRAVSSAGDINGDGFADLIVGAYKGDDGGADAGEAYMIFGAAGGFGTVDATGRSVIDLTSLTAAQGFVVQGDVAGDQAGFSVATAGDINGDGVDDMILGASRGDDGGADAGEAYVVFGSRSGFGEADATGRNLIDLTTLTPAQGFIIQGDIAGDLAGNSVSRAGDVNGDGFADLIVGASLGDDGGLSAGEAYVIFGSASGFGTADATGRRVVDLTSLTAAQGFIIQGDSSADQAGVGVAAAGDVNGDGYDDLVVGAHTGDDGGTDAGEAYVVFGSGSGFGSAVAAGGFTRQVVDLTSLTAAQGFIIQGDVAGDLTGRGVSSAGDVNGDGFDDIVIGAEAGDDGGTDAGEAYVIFGSAAGFGTAVTTAGFSRRVIDLTTLTPAQGFIIQGDIAGDLAGNSVSSAGDVNGDGFADLIVGAHLGDDGGVNAGEAYVIFGSGSNFGTADASGRRVVDLTGLNAATGFIVQGDILADFLGRAVSAAGDINGDGFDDLIAGAGWGDDGGSVAGEAYVIYGSTFGRAPALTTGTAAAEVLMGGTGNDTLTGGGGADVLRGGAGDDVLGIGDTGFADIHGGTGTDTLRLDGSGMSLNLATMAPGEISSIERIDLTGTGNNTLTLDRLSMLDLTEQRTNGVAVLTVTGNAGDSVSLADAGWLYGGTLSSGGQVFERYTSGNAELRIQNTVTSNFSRVVDTTFLAASQGFIVQGDASRDWAGRSVSSAGDINGDGFDDVIVGAHWGDDGGTDAGEAYVVFGSASGFGSADAAGRKVIDLTGLTPSEGFVIQGDAAGDYAGRSVSSAGDINGDGLDDLIVGAQLGDDGGVNGGEAYVIFGTRAGFGTPDAAGRRVIDLTSLAPAQGFIIQADVSEDRVGVSVSSAGDVNGDGFDDVIVGGNLGDDGGVNGGEAYVIFGGASSFGAVDGTGRRIIDLTSLTAAQGFIIQADVAFDYAGTSVSSAGDVNGDGFDDLIVGAPRGDDGGTDAGEAYVVFGSASGFGTAVTVGGFTRQVIDLTTLTAAQGFVIQGDEVGDRAGWSVSSAGDINGDGFDDMIVGAQRGDDGGTDAGEAYVIFGSAAGFGTVDGTGRRVIDLTALTPAQGFVIQGDTAGDTAGANVSSAGDVNGDGYDDLLVGAEMGDNGGQDAGETYVIFGTASGFGTLDATGRRVIDLTGLTAAQGFIVQGDVVGDTLGSAVAAAGDVNGDGFDDLIAGALGGDDSAFDAGEAYVIYGGAFGRGTTPVTTTGTAAAEMLVGGLGNDTLTGGGGADVLRGGAGNDVLAVSDAEFSRIDGGTGTDTLRVDGVGVSLALGSRTDGVEIFDITGTGNNTLALDGRQVLASDYERFFDFTATAAPKTLVVNGDAGDVVNLYGIDPDGAGALAASHAWQLVQSDVGLDGAAGGAYDMWSLMANGEAVAAVAVDADILVNAFG
ncbi:Ig-like domain-containing protein [Aestuariivirga sp.]|uniref:Ig-like domain-containing protein n=1 Tax=Aestuariivirga sp. TaxID=2650926 RepID=UPI00391CF331